jgi:hypothetical protein
MKLGQRIAKGGLLLEALLRWLLAYPLLTAQIVLMLLISWAGLAQELGAERLFWHEEIWLQLGTGFGVGMLYGVILFTIYITYRPSRLVRWLRRPWRLPADFAKQPYSVKKRMVQKSRHRLWTIFPSTCWEVRLLGRFLLFMLTALLVLTVSVKLFAGLRVSVISGESYFEERRYLLPHISGYILSVGFAISLFLLDEKVVKPPIRNRLLGLLLWAPDPGFHTLRERLQLLQVPPPQWPLHGIASYLMFVSVIVFLSLIAASDWLDVHNPGRSVSSPVTLVSLVLIVFSLFYGLLAFHLRIQRLILGLFVGILAGLNSTSCFPSNRYKLQFDGFEDDPQTVLWKPSTSEEGDPLTTKASEQEKDKTQDVEAVLAVTRNYADRTLIPSEEPLAAMSERWQKTHPGQKPKIIIVCASGGGIRAAVWTGVVLKNLEKEFNGENGKPRFRDHLRLITGASGGMVGSALYVADFDNESWSEKHINVLATDSLTRTAQSLLLRDLLCNTLLLPGYTASWDRGRTLQWKWGLNAYEQLKRNPFDSTFESLRALEREGLRPSIIFSPLMVEDSRRLLVSNLNIEDLTISEGPTEKPYRQLARSAVEFHRLFPDLPKYKFLERFGPSPREPKDERVQQTMQVLDALATSDRFTIGTAARMNATFPIISPAVSLPTVPARRLVDAGIYDNYGVNLATIWMLKNKDALLRHTSGVAIIQVRAFPLQEARNRFAAVNPDTGKLEARPPQGDLLADLLSAAAAPAEALLNARSNAAQFRNAELIDEVNRTFNNCPPGTPAKEQFFCTVWLELQRPASLNWYLSTVERRRIEGGYNEDTLGDQLNVLREWYGQGGK